MASNINKEIHDNLALSGTYCLEESMERLLDFDGLHTKLYKGVYKYGDIANDCLFIKNNGVVHDLGWQCSSLKKIKHTAAMKLFNVSDDLNSPRFIYGCVDGTLKKWIQVESPWSGLFIGAKKTHPSDRLKNIIGDICGVVLYLFGLNLCPLSIDWDNLYVNILGNEPFVQILLTKVELLKTGLEKTEQENRVWSQVRKIFEDICEMCNVDLSLVLQRFSSFIGKSSFLQRLENYPFTWDEEMKASILNSIVAANQSITWVINATKKPWPEWPILEQISEGYKKTEYYDYIRLIRNSYKHFKIFYLL